jgi:hypothetical protein
VGVGVTVPQLAAYAGASEGWAAGTNCGDDFVRAETRIWSERHREVGESYRPAVPGDDRIIPC